MHINHDHVRGRSAPLLAAIVLATAMVTAIAADPKASRYYEDALGRFDKQDMAGAIIQLKNALQADPNMLAAHVLLGKALLNNGDPVGAEVELDTALKLGVGRAEVVVLLGQAYLKQGKYGALLERITPGGLPPPAQVDVLLLRANAQAEDGHHNTALKTLEEARALDPRSVPIRLAQATIHIRTGDLARAATVTDEALSLAPNDAVAWNTRASILHLKGDLPGALSAYAKASGINPKYLDPRVTRAGLLVDMGRMDDAAREVAEVLAIEPREPRANYLKAVIAASRGDKVTVKSSLEQVIQLLDPIDPAVLALNRQMLLLAGLAHYELGNQEKALEKLSAYLHRHPGEPGPTKLLASLHLDRGESRIRAVACWSRCCAPRPTIRAPCPSCHRLHEGSQLSAKPRSCSTRPCALRVARRISAPTWASAWSAPARPRAASSNCSRPSPRIPGRCVPAWR